METANRAGLAAQYNVSRYTIQEAIKKLKDMGMVNVIQGSGIFLNKNLQTSPLIYNSLTENPYSSIKSKVIELQKQPASPEDQQIFGITGNLFIWYYITMSRAPSLKSQALTDKNNLYSSGNLAHSRLDNVRAQAIIRFAISASAIDKTGCFL